MFQHYNLPRSGRLVFDGLIDLSLTFDSLLQQEYRLSEPAALHFLPAVECQPDESDQFINSNPPSQKPFIGDPAFGYIDICIEKKGT